jgi:hypothetical protein
MLVVAENTIKLSLSMAISAFGETPTISRNLERQLRMPPLSLRFPHRLTFALLSLMTEKNTVTCKFIHPAYIFASLLEIGNVARRSLYCLYSRRHYARKKGTAMTAIALNTANRSAAFLSSFIDALDKAITMAKAVHHDSANAADMKKVRAIAETI